MPTACSTNRIGEASERLRLRQKSYYDHVLRRDEDAGDVVGYITENPVRAALAASTGDYPFAWSAFGALETV